MLILLLAIGALGLAMIAPALGGFVAFVAVIWLITKIGFAWWAVALTLGLAAVIAVFALRRRR